MKVRFDYFQFWSHVICISSIKETWKPLPIMWRIRLERKRTGMCQVPILVFGVDIFYYISTCSRVRSRVWDISEKWNIYISTPESQLLTTSYNAVFVRRARAEHYATVADNVQISRRGFCPLLNSWRNGNFLGADLDRQIISRME